MTYNHRPDPDEILKAIKNNPSSKVGRLRVFLGMSAGVGKTYAMLEAAHQKMKEGVDVVIGIVETHERAETAALLSGLEVIPRKKVFYRSTNIEELDLDAIIKRKPHLVIVDELAHTNAPGSRHQKRYQDVYELLEAGIDVFTALNIQHLESRREAIESITGLPVRESVPDGILDRANLVQLVDVAPEEVLKRLREGKVYLGDKAERASQNFFKEDKLTALREIALRITAERVDQDLQKITTLKSETKSWRGNEKILVGISHSPYSENLIRATRRLAYSLEAPWIAVHVNTGISLSNKDQIQLTKNIALARELNAEVLSVNDVDVFSALQRICQQRSITKILIGRPSMPWYRQLLEGGSLLKKLLRENSDLDINIVRPHNQKKIKRRFLEEFSLYLSKESFIKYWYTLWAVITTTLLGGLLNEFIGYRSVGFFFLLSVLIIGMFGSPGAVIFSALLSSLIWDYFFIPPSLTFDISNADDILMCLSFFVVAVITGSLASRIKSHERLLREREERTQILYQILQDLTSSNIKKEFLSKTALRLQELFGGVCGFISTDKNGLLDISDLKSYGITLEDKEKAIGQWAYDNNKAAGWSTDTLSQSKYIFLPLIGISQKVGVFVMQSPKKSHRLSMEKENLLYSITRQSAISIERNNIEKQLSESLRIQDSENLHQVLLSSISHEIRTPLTAIIGIATELESQGLKEDNKSVKDAATALQLSGDRLNRVVENLLDMSRLNSGVLSLNKEWYDLNDLVSVAIDKLDRPLSNHKITVDLSKEAPILKIDFRLIEHAFTNLLMNSVMYTPVDSEIHISTKKENDNFILSVQDNGPGIPNDCSPKIFEKFYRLPGSPPGGVGLGLSLVKNIVELHGGSVEFRNVHPHGSCFTIKIPLSQHSPMFRKDLL